MKEVNFEKRGKLPNHVTCPVTGECICVCSHCKPIKKLFAGIILTLFLLLPNLSAAQSVIPYTVTLTDEVQAVDLNSKGWFIRNVREVNGSDRIAQFVKKNRTFDINCGGDTLAQDLTNPGQVVGGCVTASFGAPQYGFSWTQGAGLSLLSVPGADGTIAYAASDDGVIGGQLYDPLDFNRSGLYRFKGWLRIGTSYFRVEFPLPDTYTDVLGVNKRGNASVEWVQFDPVTNATLNNGWAIYRNGQFELLPFSADTIDVLGPNNEDDLLVIRPNGKVLLYSDAILFEIGFPSIPGRVATWNVRGFNDDLELIGMVNLYDPNCTAIGFGVCSTQYGFTAAPTPQPRVKR